MVYTVYDYLADSDGRLTPDLDSSITSSQTPLSAAYEASSHPRLLITPAPSTEHVLRPTASASNVALRSGTSTAAFRARSGNARSSSATTNPFLTAPANVAPVDNSLLSKKKVSPTPSIKRNKAAKLLKEHGSPPGLRVTAGGRIVPNDLPHLSSPQLNYSGLNGRNSDATAHASPVQSFNSMSYIGAPGEMSTILGTANDMMAQHGKQLSQGYAGPAVFTPDNYQFFAPGQVPAPGFPMFPQPSPINAAQPQPMNTNTKLQCYRQEHEKLIAHRKQLERSLVVNEGTITPQARQTMIEDKIRMTTEADKLRREIKQLEDLMKTSEKPGKAAPAEGETKPAVGSSSFPPYMLQPDHVALQMQGMFNPFGGYGQFVNPMIAAMVHAPEFQPSTMPLATPSMAPPPVPTVYTANAHPGVAQQRSNVSLDTAAQSPNESTSASRARRSHAVEIKDPRSVQSEVKTKRSSLNPTSPTYQPQKSGTPDTEPQNTFVPPSPSPIASPPLNAAFQADFPWLCRTDERANQQYSSKASDQSSKHKPSASSVNTDDFFPPNAHSYATKFSTVKGIRSTEMVAVSAKVVNAQPMTPDGNPRGPGPLDTVSSSQHSQDFIDQVLANSQKTQRSDKNASGSEGMTSQSNAVAAASFNERGSIKARPSRFTEQLDRDSQSGKGSNTPDASTVRTINYMDKSVDWIQGWLAGLSGQPIEASETAEFMRGYGTGLIKAKRDTGLNGSVGSIQSKAQLPSQHMYELPGNSSQNQLTSGQIKPTQTQHLDDLSKHARVVEMNRSLGSDTRPNPTQFASFTSTRSIVSDMGIRPGLNEDDFSAFGLRTKQMSRREEAPAREYRNMSQPMIQHSGNEREDRQFLGLTNDQSPTKASRAASSSKAHGQHKFLPGNFSFGCIGDHGRGLRTNFDGTMEEYADKMEAPMPSPKSPSTNGAPPTKSVVPGGFSSSPTKATGSPKKFFMTSPSKASLEQKFSKRKEYAEEREYRANSEEVLGVERKYQRGGDWRKRFRDIKERSKDLERYVKEQSIE
ncbi:hypothetical protein K490DRAFT_64264 [Saccharata proteae CBS 121410]|uniref:Uncharacterized protein n=1 Tax=Saccharata proteae CBS 121410 TaxID=1314787 RepID=A0A6A5YB11_9PEZI|nr:hypothetical protein K490DRAFT_64264 [Saccharata proteae CBS 121410]